MTDENMANGQTNSPVKGWKTGVVIGACLLIVAGVFLAKSRVFRSGSQEKPSASVASAPDKGPALALPTLLDLGAGKCIPCKMMAPILEELEKEYAGQFNVRFIDVWENQQAARKWRVRSIPTQIFLDGSGWELYRHVGFFSKEDILSTWRKLGVEVH